MTKTSKNAEQWIASYNKILGGDKPIDKLTISKIEWHRLLPTDNQFILCTDAGQGKVVKVSGMFLTMDNASVKAQIEEISLRK